MLEKKYQITVQFAPNRNLCSSVGGILDLYSRATVRIA
jgi:hypothetical protein